LGQLQLDEVANALEMFVGYSRGFTLNEFIDWLDTAVDRGKARQTLMDDPRFIWLGPQTYDEDYFVPERTLFQWWSHLSLRLSQACQAMLTRRQLAVLMSSLRLDGRWETPPDAAVSFGQRFGFVGAAWTSEHYVFPLARVLSSLSLPPTKVASNLLRRLANVEKRDFALKRWLEEAFRKGLSQFGERVAQVMVAREGLQPEGEMTLKQIGDNLGLTRERVRQIEAKFWARLSKHAKRDAFIEPFLTAFLCDVMLRRGSLIVNTDSPDASLTKFLAKCLDIPWAQVPHTEIAVLWSSLEDFAPLLTSDWFPDQIDSAVIAQLLCSRGNLYLTADDLLNIAESVAIGRLKQLNKAQKVYIALRHVGRPAHYSKITEVYNSMFPDDLSTQHSIHAILSRCASPEYEQYGVVWTGIRGTYALKEWGYERPSKGLFEAVTEIVTKKYQETGRAVPFVVIAAEIGKYRQVVQPTSLFFATHFNPSLHCVSEDAFVPREPVDKGQDEITQDKLDRILREFEQRKGI
jgi:hypothetical protein